MLVQKEWGEDALPVLNYELRKSDNSVENSLAVFKASSKVFA